MDEKKKDLIEVLGFVVTVLGLIFAILQWMQGREQKDIEQQQVQPVIPSTEIPAVAPSVPEAATEEKPKRKSVILTVSEGGFQHVDFADTELSVVFRNMNGEEYVSLYITPTAQKSSVHAVVIGSAIEFTSLDESYSVQIIKVDYSGRQVSLKVNCISCVSE